MSLERHLLKARLAALNPPTSLPSSSTPPTSGPSADQDHDEQDEETDTFSSTPALLPLKPRRPLGKSRDYTPISGSAYFTEALSLPLSSTTFRLYHSPPTPAHPTFICLHGAGYSALSFALLAKELRDQGAGVLTYDCRGHGKTITDADAAPGEGDQDLSLDRMTQDLVAIVREIFTVESGLGEKKKDVILVGHSMGGAVAVQGCPLLLDVVNVVGLAVLDVVEGTALEALSSMTSLIASHPKGFSSVETGIEWHVRSKTLHNTLSARISVPPILILSPQASKSEFAYSWRTDLLATKPFWEEWFTGLSNKFLACKTAKLLVLAGADRLDKDLMIGQMQGKFQQEVFTDVGHSLQEDAPERTADLLMAFWRRNDRTDVLKGVKKVGQI